MSGHLGAVPAEVPDGERIWESTWMVHPSDREEVDVDRARARFGSGFGPLESWLGAVPGARPARPERCETLADVAAAWSDGDVDAVCEAVLDYWGCDEPDFAWLFAQEERALDLVAELIDPDCSSLSLSLSLSLSDVSVSCELPPCTLTLPDDGSAHAGLCTPWRYTLWTGEERGEGPSLVTLPLSDSSDAQEAFRPSTSFRVESAQEAWHGRAP